MAAPKIPRRKAGGGQVLRAYLKAHKDTVAIPPAHRSSCRDDTAKKDIDLKRLRIAIPDNIVTPAVKANGYRGIDPARLTAAIDQLALAYHFKAKDKANEAFDPAFLPGAAERWRGLFAAAVTRVSPVLAGGSPLQRGQIELLHLQDGLHDPIGSGAAGIHHHLRQHRRHHLPGQTVFVLQPAAGSLLAAFAEFVPK